MTGNPLGTATGRIVLDPSGVRTGMEEAKRLARDGFAGFKDIVVGGMQGIGQTLTGVGTQMTAAMAPVGAAFAVATNAGLNFDETMTNVGAVLNLTRGEIDTMKGSIQAFGETTRFGPQKVAEAFYDVVGGVSDASLHMAILEQSVRTAEAGNSDLGATTNALISIMNSYKLSAEDAGLASDVLTRTVGMGVGTMDELAAAMPQVTGLAQSLNIPLDELGSMFAYLSTQGNTFNQSGTQVSAMMTALLNPNEKMKAALASIGQTTGKAAVENLGLIGTYNALLNAGFGDDMAGMTGSVEALRGVTALTGEGVDEFFTTFEEGLDGATDAAREVQMGSAAAEVDLLTSSFDGLKLMVADVLMPNLRDFAATGREVIGTIKDWMRENPELAQQIIMILAALLPLGPVLATAGLMITGMATAIGFLLSPIGLLIAIIVALGVAYATNFGGMRDAVDGAIAWILPKLESLKNWFMAEGLPVIQQGIANFLTGWMLFRDFLASTWDAIQPKLQGMYTWFVETALPAIKQELAEWLPGIQEAINILKGWWDEISPALQNIYDWFITTALPTIAEAIAYFVVNYVQYLADEVSAIWETVSPWLLKFYEWFKVNGLPTIAEGITTFLENNFNPFVRAFSKLIDEAGPVLQEFKRIITTVVMPAIREALRDVGTAIQDVKDAFNRIWDSISGKVNEFKINIEKVMDAVGDAIQPIIDLIDDVISGLDKVKSAGGLLDKVGGILPFAEGGGYSAGRPRIVGEAGAEMDVPSSSGMVVSGDQLATALNVLAGGFRNVSALVGAAQQTLSAAQGVGGGGGINIGNIQIVVPEWKTENPRQAGREMGIGFEEKLKELFRGKG